MWFQIDSSGIKIKLQIKGYKPVSKDDWYSEWCSCDFLFSSDEWLNYHKEDVEVLLSAEVEGLAKALSDLLDNKLSEETEISCIEPDFAFKLFPQKDLSGDPKYAYIRPGCEIQDIYLEWKIFFWNQGLTENYLTITLYRDDIKRLRDYFSLVIKQ